MDILVMLQRFAVEIGLARRIRIASVAGACVLLGCSELDHSNESSGDTAALQGSASLDGTKHPSELSPSDTLVRILDAYVRFDVETVLSHIHPNTKENDERMASWRDFVSRSCTRENHVIEVVGVKLLDVTSKERNMIARLLATVRTTSGFSGRPISADGTREYEWSLVQLDGTGAWYHYGDGF